MEFLLTKGIIHVHGTLLWTAVITIISIEIIRVFAREKRRYWRRPLKLRLPVPLTFLMTLFFIGSTGLFFLFEWKIWNNLMEVDFWWAHSMILSWILFSIVFFVLDPYLLKKIE